MNRKKNKFKLIRFLFYCLGLPCMCLTTLWLLSPMFTEQVMGKFPAICAAVPFIMWAVIELVRIALKKFSKKGAIKQDVATLILIVCSTFIIVVPTLVADKVISDQYNEIRTKALTATDPVEFTYVDPITNEEKKDTIILYDGQGVNFPTYNKIMGWATDSTNKGSSHFHSFVAETKGYISNWGLAGYATAVKGNSAPKEVNYDSNLDGKVDDKDVIIIGERLGLYDHLAFMEKGKYNYSIISAQLNKELEILNTARQSLLNNITTITADITKAQEDNNTAKVEELKVKQKQAQDELVKFDNSYRTKMNTLGGQVVRVYNYQIEAVLDIVGDLDYMIPNGLDINALGMTLPVGDLLSFIKEILGVAGDINLNDMSLVKTLLNAVCTNPYIVDPLDPKSVEFGAAHPDAAYLEIATGLAKNNQYQECAAAANKIATDKNTYKDIKVLEYKLDIYPQVLAFARLKRVLFIFAGLVIISLLVSDHYTRKINQIDKILFNDRVEQIIKDQGLVNSNDSVALKIVNDADIEVNANTTLDLNDNINTNVNEIKVDDSTKSSDLTIDNNQEEVKQEEVKPLEDKKEENIPRPQGIDLTQGGNENENK